jgi:ATP-dependent Clp protease adaptor protein ClpS
MYLFALASPSCYHKVNGSGGCNLNPQFLQMPENFEETVVLAPERTRPKRRRRGKTRRQPPYAVILHNDDVNGFDFVIETLQKVFGYELQKALVLTLEAHDTGRSCVWSGHRELAELKADQVKSCGPDPRMADRGAQPLCVTVEPLPSE